MSLEGARPGTNHNMKSKCGGWEIQVQVAILAKVKIDLQLFQKHFSFCTIVHLIYFWHQNIKYLNNAFPESPQYIEQPISGSASPLIPKSLWLENMYLHRSSNLGCWPCEKVIMSSSSEDGKKALKFIPTDTAQLLRKGKMAQNCLPFSYSVNVQWI